VLAALGLGAGALAASPLLAACGGGTSTATTSAGGGGAAPVKAQLGWLKLTQFGGFFAAQEKGYYAEEKLAPTFTPGGPNILAWQSVASRGSLTGDDDNTNVLVAIAKGQPLVIYGAIFQTSPFAVISKADKPVTSIQDFAGRTIAIPEAARQQVTGLLKGAGIDPGKVKLIPAGPDPTQLVTGQADGYWGYATAQGVALEAQGLDINVLYLEQLGIPSYGNVLIAKKDDVEKNQDQLVRYLRASAKGFEYMNKNPDEIGRLVATKYGPSGLKPETEIATAKFQKDLIESPKGVLAVDPDKMQKIVDGLVKVGTLPSAPKVSDIVTTAVHEKAFGGKTSLLG
jgi:NitT/TauT family transport system substrate-binding protein